MNFLRFFFNEATLWPIPEKQYVHFETWFLTFLRQNSFFGCYVCLIKRLHLKLIGVKTIFCLYWRWKNIFQFPLFLCKSKETEKNVLNFCTFYTWPCKNCLSVEKSEHKRGLCTTESIKNQALSCSESKLFCFKYRLMSFKEEPRKEKLSLPLIFFGEK